MFAIPARRPEAFQHFDEALAIVRRLMAADLATHGPTFIRWVHWPVAECLRADGQNSKADALTAEAAAVQAQLSTP